MTVPALLVRSPEVFLRLELLQAIDPWYRQLIEVPGILLCMRTLAERPDALEIRELVNHEYIPSRETPYV